MTVFQIEVHHAKEPKFFYSSKSLDDKFEVRSELNKGNDVGNYRKVAHLEIEADSTNEALNKAYQVTNHIDSDWTKNPEVAMTMSYRGSGFRSSSVGDVFVILGDNRYVVANFGFDVL